MLCFCFLTFENLKRYCANKIPKREQKTKVRGSLKSFLSYTSFLKNSEMLRKHPLKKKRLVLLNPHKETKKHPMKKRAPNTMVVFVLLSKEKLSRGEKNKSEKLIAIEAKSTKNGMRKSFLFSFPFFIEATSPIQKPMQRAIVAP